MRHIIEVTPTLEASIYPANTTLTDLMLISNDSIKPSTFTMLDQVTVIDIDNVSVAFDIAIFSDLVTLGAKKSSWAAGVSRADSKKLIGVIPIEETDYSATLKPGVVQKKTLLVFTPKQHQKLYAVAVNRNSTPQYQPDGLTFKFILSQ